MRLGDKLQTLRL